MDGGSLLQSAVARINELPGAELTHPFGPDVDVYKVRGKIFALVMADPGKEMVNLKAVPQQADELREAFDDIQPGYHMNKKHWISLVAGGSSLQPRDVEDLVTESYLLIVDKLPKRDRPVDPELFGQGYTARD